MENETRLSPRNTETILRWFELQGGIDLTPDEQADPIVQRNFGLLAMMMKEAEKAENAQAIGVAMSGIMFTGKAKNGRRS